jgi:hypothetical protein
MGLMGFGLAASTHQTLDEEKAQAVRPKPIMGEAAMILPTSDRRHSIMGIKKMRILIKRDGRTEIRVECGQGDDCLAFTQAVERALGVVEQRQLTAEYDQEPVVDPVYLKASSRR